MHGIVTIILIAIPVLYIVRFILDAFEICDTLWGVLDFILFPVPVWVVVWIVCLAMSCQGFSATAPNNAQHISNHIYYLDGKAVTFCADPNQDKADAFWNGVRSVAQEVSPEETLDVLMKTRPDSATFELLKSTTRSCHAEERVLKYLMDQPVTSLDTNMLLFMEECAAKCGVKLPHWGEVQTT